MKIFLMLLVLFYSGCSNKRVEIEKVERTVFSCDKEAEPKSLNYLEQNYRCRGEEN